MALKAANGEEKVWAQWDPAVEPDRQEHEARRFWQFLFFRQWGDLKRHCAERGVRIMGDVPVYVAHDSADVWSHGELFHLDAQGWPSVVAGVPPDYFSATGQRWGNPIYRWDTLAETGYAWWIDRMRHAFSMVDILRLDHFRGFESYWEVPAGEATAQNGRWVPGPGAGLFSAFREALGELAIVAENLGIITSDVEELRSRFDFPGMSILQFAFRINPPRPSFRPHNYPRHHVAYTGSHDNDTVGGWWNDRGSNTSVRSPEDIVKEHTFARDYLGLGAEPIHWTMIRTLMASVADTVIVPLQDVLGLGSEGRMNRPGRAGGNWRWRYATDDLTPDHARRLRELTTLYER